MKGGKGKLPVISYEVRTFEHLNEECRSLSVLNSLFVCSIVLNFKPDYQFIHLSYLKNKSLQGRISYLYLNPKEKKELSSLKNLQK